MIHDLSGKAFLKPVKDRMFRRRVVKDLRLNPALPHHRMPVNLPDARKLARIAWVEEFSLPYETGRANDGSRGLRILWDCQWMGSTAVVP